jgi:aminopeptidase N
VIDTLSHASRDPALASAALAAVRGSLSAAEPLDATAAEAIVRAAARNGDAALWDRLHRAETEATSPADRYRYLYALAYFEDPALIDRGLNLALSPAIRSQDAPSFLAGFLANTAARPRAWSFIKQHWTELAPKVTISLGDVRLVESLGAFCDVAARDDIRSFFATRKLPAATRALGQTIESIDNCVSLRQKQTPELAKWLGTS